MGACRELIDNALDAHATSIGKFLMNWNITKF
jgi:DNA mismatch repair ATPase MutL